MINSIFGFPSKTIFGNFFKNPGKPANNSEYRYSLASHGETSGSLNSIALA
jgi:hypothetical protein